MINEIVLFESEDHTITIPVKMHNDTVWLTRNQLSELFGRDVKTIGKHVNNALREELDSSVVAKFATTASDGKTYQTDHYNLDMIISIGYRVKSKRGVEFRRWANRVLKEYIIHGYAVNENRIKQLGSSQIVLNCLAVRKMILLRAVLGTSISLLADRKSIRA